MHDTTTDIGQNSFCQVSFQYCRWLSEQGEKYERQTSFQTVDIGLNSATPNVSGQDRSKKILIEVLSPVIVMTSASAATVVASTYLSHGESSTVYLSKVGSFFKIPETTGISNMAAGA